MVVPGATGYYIIDRPPSSRVPISCRDPCRSPGTAGLRVNLCTSAAEKKNVYRHISITDRVSLQTFSSLSPLPQFDHAHASANIYRGRVPLPLPIVVSRRNNCWSAYAIRYATVTYSKYITYYSIITYLLLRSTFRITFFIFNVPYFTSKKKNPLHGNLQRIYILARPNLSQINSASVFHEEEYPEYCNVAGH